MTTIVSPILDELPLEDSGAQTADRYEWQTSMAVIDGLAAVVGAWANGGLTKAISIVCELHEDYVICIDHALELVSVKHRDSSQGAWTFSQLMSVGGVPHLFARWRSLDQLPRTRLVTNSSPSGEAADLVSLCDRLREHEFGPLRQSDQVLLDKVCHKLFLELAAEERVQSWLVAEKIYTAEFSWLVRRFLCRLRVDSTRTNRDDLSFAAPTKYVTPFLTAIGADPALATAVWQQAVQLFRPRMQGRGATPLGGLTDALVGVHNLTAPQANKLHVDARRVSAEDLLEVVEICVNLSLAAIPPHHELAATTLGVKLLNAGLTPTTIHMAEDAALRWRAYESMSVGDAFGEMSVVRNAKLAIHQLASSVHEQMNSQVPDGGYGPAMWAKISEMLVPDGLEPTPPGLSKVLMIGAICDLTSQCKIWFSPEFDISKAKHVFPQLVLTGEVSDAA